MLELPWLYGKKPTSKHPSTASSQKRLVINLFIAALITSIGESHRQFCPASGDEKPVPMADTPILLREQQYHQIKAVLARLRMDSAAKVVFLVEKDGQEIAVLGEVANLDTTSLASLAAGNVAATGGMAELIGEKEFPTLSHEGEKESIHISVIGRILLIIVFDERSSLGLVKLRSKQVSHQLAAMFDEITRADNNDLESPFAGITDEDIDSLFS